MPEVRDRIGHLFRRAGFGAPPAEIDRWAAAGLAAAVDHLLDAPAEPEAIPLPDLKPAYDPERPLDLQTGWLHRMVATRYPLAEKMTLFWHGHFATSVRKVGRPALMQRQNDLFRRHALGAFPALLREVGRDGAMLIWLDGHGSHRRAPNENYAREIMELFTTGPGPYTEQDVQEAARALTGWRVDRATLAVWFNPFAHDPRPKTFLGQTGRFRADEIADILSARPETARFLAGKLWRFFASPTPDEGTVEQMAAAYTASHGQVKPMLRALFLANAFYAADLAGARVKSPVELVVGTLRLLGLPVSRPAAGLCTRMGQSLLDPPSVAGWPGGAAWLSAATLLARWNLGEAVRSGLGQRPRADLDLPAAGPGALVDAWLDYLGVVGPSAATRGALLDLVGEQLPAQPRRRWELTRTLVRAIVAAPEYQTV